MLIVEDEPVMALDMQAIIAAMGVARVDVAATAAAAIAALAGSAPHLVVLDLSLAGSFAGIEIARRIGVDGIAMLVCSGHLGDGAAAGVQDIGAAGYLAKPFHPVNLRETVAAALDALP